MPNAGDELHHFGWNRCSSACHGPDRSHLIVPGFRSSRFHIVNVADDPRRPRIEKVIEPEEVVAKTGYTRPHTVHCMPGDNIVVSMLGDAEGNGAGGFAVLDAQTFELKGRWENGGETASAQLRLLVPAAQERARLDRVRRAERVRERVRSRPTSRQAGTGSGSTSGISRRASSSRPSISARTGLVPLEVRWLHDPDAEEGFVGSRALEHDVALPPERRLGGRPGDRGRERSARGLAVPGAGPDHRPRRSRWTTASSTSRTGSTATCASTTSPTRATRSSPARSGWAA